MQKNTRGLVAAMMGMAAGMGVGIASTDDLGKAISEVPPKPKPRSRRGTQSVERRRVHVQDLDAWNSKHGAEIRAWNIAVERKKLAKQQAKIDVAKDQLPHIHQRALDRMSILRRHANLY